MEYLKIRLVVREVATFQNEEEFFSKEAIIPWQQKLYGPQDIADYISHKHTNRGTAAQFETRRHFRQLEKGGQKIDEMVDDVMIYTYVDKDHYSPEMAPPVWDNNGQESYLGAAVSALGKQQNTNDVNDRDMSIARRIFKDKPFKTMHICMATDIDKEKLLKQTSYESPNAHFQEHILCSIHMYQDGLLEVTPAFSGVVDELTPAGEENEHAIPISVFFNDPTAETAIKKGLKLSTFRIHSKTGVEYEFVLQNINDLLIPHKIEALLKEESAQRSMLAAETRFGESDNWKQDPSRSDRTVVYYAEIVDASGFDGYRHYVNYQIKHPTNWELRTGNLTDGVANTEMTSQVDEYLDPQQTPIPAAATAAAAAMMIDIDDPKKGMLQGTTQLAHTEDEIRTLYRLPRSRPLWGGGRVYLALHKSSRFLAAFLLFAVTGLAVVVGPAYPFWIAPALIFWFILGTGMPGGPVDVVLVNDSKKGQKKSGVEGSNTRTRSRHNPLGLAVLKEPWADCCSAFNHLISVSFDVADNNQDYFNASPSSKCPIMLFNVYSKDWFGRQKLEGYGYFNLPDQSGMHDVEIKTWRPRASISSNMSDFFLGSAARLRDDSFVESATRTSKSINKFGLLTESSGKVRIKVQVLVTDERNAVKDDLSGGVDDVGMGSSMGGGGTGGFGGTAGSLGGTLNSTKKSADVRRSVDEILKSFRSGPNSLNNSLRSSAGGGLGTGTASAAETHAKPSISTIMSSLNATSKASNVADILARSRAKLAAIGKGGGGKSSKTAVKNNNADEKGSSEPAKASESETASLLDKGGDGGGTIPPRGRPSLSGAPAAATAASKPSTSTSESASLLDKSGVGGDDDEHEGEVAEKPRLGAPRMSSSEPSKSNMTPRKLGVLVPLKGPGAAAPSSKPPDAAMAAINAVSNGSGGKKVSNNGADAVAAANEESNL